MSVLRCTGGLSHADRQDAGVLSFADAAELALLVELDAVRMDKDLGIDSFLDLCRKALEVEGLDNGGLWCLSWGQPRRLRSTALRMR